MGKLGDFLNKGVSLIVVNKSDPQAAELKDQLLSEIAPGPAEAPAAPSQVPADVEDFSAVYEEAGIKPPAHGYGVDKVAEMLANKRLATLSREVKATAIVTALEAAGAPVDDVVQDAARRDRAIDEFERAKRSELDNLKNQGAARVQTIEEELQRYLRDKNAEIEAIKQAVDAAEQAFAQLQIRKKREEERLFGIVAHFVTDAENPVTVAAQGAAPKPDAATNKGGQ